MRIVQRYLVVRSEAIRDCKRVPRECQLELAVAVIPAASIRTEVTVPGRKEQVPGVVRGRRGAALPDARPALITGRACIWRAVENRLQCAGGAAECHDPAGIRIVVAVRSPGDVQNPSAVG